MRVHVTPKKFTPNLQIFYTFPVFGLNVKVFGVKVPPMKRIIFINQRQKRVCYSQKIYPRPQDFLHGYIRHIRAIMQLCVCQSKLINDGIFFVFLHLSPT